MKKMIVRQTVKKKARQVIKTAKKERIIVKLLVNEKLIVIH